MAYNSIDRSRNDELKTLTRRLEAREEELQRIIQDTEGRYSEYKLGLLGEGDTVSIRSGYWARDMQ